MGEIIYYRRRAMKIGQKNLCQGICSRGTLSRFENGRQTLSYNRVSALFQRLGLPDNCFYALLSEDELALKEAEREARDASVELERALAQGRPAAWARLREALGRLEALGRNDPFARQCVLSQRAVEGREDGPYPFKERLAMLLEAVRLTVPQFNLERAGLGPYSGEELRLIMLIANMWMNPLMFNCTAEKSRRKFLLFRQIMQGFGLDIVDDEMLERLLELSALFVEHK